MNQIKRLMRSFFPVAKPIYRRVQGQLRILAVVLLASGSVTAVHASLKATPANQSTGQDAHLWQLVASELEQHADFMLPADNLAVRQEINWLKRNPEYLYSVTQRSEPYVYHIVQQCLERGLPLELVLLPIVESAYDAYAYSPGRATGLWQFIPSTGKHFGLEQNWWYDGRRDPVASTSAALTYLTQLHQRFDDWLLALAAYNAGPARISRAIKKNHAVNKQGDYWSLKLPKETRRYVPRLLAIREVITRPEKYNVRLYPIASAEYFRQVDVGGQIDLAQAAEMASVDMETIYRLNPGYNRWATPPEGPHKLLLPIDQSDVFTTTLAQTDLSDRLRWKRYIVKPGDTLSGIAMRFNTRHKLIVQANEIGSSMIRTGQALMIPIASRDSAHYVLSQEQRDLALGKSKPGMRKQYYTVKRGDSWWKVGKTFGVTPGALAKWNGKAPGDMIRPGQKLVVWKKGSVKDRNRVSRSFTYKVKTGDNLSRIASRYKVSVNELLSWNGLSTKKYLQPGQALKIKVAVAGGI